MSEFGYIPQSSEQKFNQNTGIFTPKDIYNLTKADKYTNLGQLELIETQTVSGVSAVDFTNIKSDIYTVHYMTWSNIQSAPSSTSYFGLRYYNEGVLDTAAYKVAFKFNSVNGSNGEIRSTNININSIGVATGNTIVMNGFTYLYNLGAIEQYSYNTGVNNVPQTTGTPFSSIFHGVSPQQTKVDGIRLTSDTSQTLSSGSVSLFGVKAY